MRVLWCLHAGIRLFDIKGYAFFMLSHRLLQALWPHEKSVPDSIAWLI